MSYIDETLLPNEKVLYRSRPHYIVFSSATVWFAVSIFLFIFGPRFLYTAQTPFSKLPFYALVALAALIFSAFTAIGALINYQTSEYGITNKRILLKIGFIRRLSLEIYLQKIESIKVNQSILGRILGYGSIVVSGVGGSKDAFANIPNPLEFRHRVQEQIERVEK